MGIHIEDLSFAYGDKKVLYDICLSVKKGEHIGIIGTSGGGKSTLLKLLSGLYEKQCGCLAVHGEQTPAQIRKHVAMVMQGAQLFPTSIRENITCGHPIPDEMVDRAVRVAQLEEWVQTLPDGLDTFVGERGGKVSGGQAQRIAIARAIAKDAPVIFMDEAFSALDGTTANLVLHALEEWSQGKTVASVSHQKEALSNASRLYVLEGGRLHDA